MEMALLIFIASVVMPVLFCLAFSGEDDFSRIEAYLKKRGGKDIQSRVNPFGGQFNYEVTYRDAGGNRRVAHCHFDLSGRMYFGEAVE